MTHTADSAWKFGYERPYSRVPGMLPLTATGAGLWALYVDPVPGMVGSFHYVHRLNVPCLYRPRVFQFGGVFVSGAVFRMDRYQWYTDRLHVAYTARWQGKTYALAEQKFITADDLAVGASTATIWLSFTKMVPRSLESSPAQSTLPFRTRPHGLRKWVTMYPSHST